MGGGSVEVLPAADFARGDPRTSALDEAAAEKLGGNVWLASDFARFRSRGSLPHAPSNEPENTFNTESLGRKAPNTPSNIP